MQEWKTLESWQSGRLRIFAKDVGPLKVSRVRIPPTPPNN